MITFRRAKKLRRPKSKIVRGFGIGDLIVFTDREYRWPIHTDISEARVIQLYNHDVGVALKDARWLHPDFDDLPDPARIVIASLSF